ncbi:Nop domain-containing protein [Trichodelitschia bisporula]|uniref:Nucleolar protein 58 n=1 Tax=Trichodelitschia bisporula TaxID=703511 RepID=A0A6G1HU57_9PEZI|nr:Nop domain-containing protein [Trichodelitschia bisporula]
MAPLFLLTETAAGYALFKSTDKKLLERADLADVAQDPVQTGNVLKLKDFKKFDTAAIALSEAAAIGEGKVTPFLASFLNSLKSEKKASLAVADARLGKSINALSEFSIKPIVDAATAELHRAVRQHMSELLPQLTPQDISTMSLGLSHSLSRHKLKFSADKVDTMIIQAISSLDDLDKELNTYAMRVKEWYGWHFPELARIINDNIAYAKLVLTVGMRQNFSSSDMSDILPEEIEGAVKSAAEVSMGTEITDIDLVNIQALAEQVIGLNELRQDLSSYLTSRMQAIAPNLTALVGELVGARLIAHSGSLMSLAKSPASTIQILGAEKALFRALKTKHDTPKYGLIYHASLIGQATGKNKGKIARVLAAKAALGVRVDSLAGWGADQENANKEATEEERSAMGVQSRIYVENKLRKLEGRPINTKGALNANLQPVQPGKWSVKEARKYNKDADGLAGDEPAAALADLSMTDAAQAGAEESSDEESEDEEEKPTPKAKNGEISEKEQRAMRKAAKKAEKAAKKAAKEAKKAAKEAKKVGAGDKRKRDEDATTPEKKKKKKSKA